MPKNSKTQTFTLPSLRYGNSFVIPSATQSHFREYYQWNDLNLNAASEFSYANAADANGAVSDKAVSVRLFAEFAAKAPCNN